MRAKEFIITVDVDNVGEPNINVQPVHRPQPVAPRPVPRRTPCGHDQDHLEPEYDYDDDPETPDPDEADDIMVTPQQQEIELQKAALGKKSVVASQLVDDAEDDEIS